MRAAPASAAISAVETTMQRKSNIGAGTVTSSPYWGARSRSATHAAWSAFSCAMILAT